MRKGTGLLIVLLLLITSLGGCAPGILVSRQAPTAQGITVEFRLGDTVETEDWVAFQKQVCRDLPDATTGLPEESRQEILKYSCTEPNRDALGKTLSKLQPDQVQSICERLNAKGYRAKTDEIPTPYGVIGPMIGVFLIMAM